MSGAHLFSSEGASSSSSSCSKNVEARLLGAEAKKVTLNDPPTGARSLPFPTRTRSTAAPAAPAATTTAAVATKQIDWSDGRRQSAVSPSATFAAFLAKEFSMNYNLFPDSTHQRAERFSRRAAALADRTHSNATNRPASQPVGSCCCCSMFAAHVNGWMNGSQMAERAQIENPRRRKAASAAR